MTLEELRKKALYQNSIEIWIGISEEKKLDWVKMFEAILCSFDGQEEDGGEEESCAGSC